MAVTAYRYELPLCVADNLHELAVYAGMKRCTMTSYMARGMRRKEMDCRFIKVELEE
jgi:hypothetical protein